MKIKDKLNRIDWIKEYILKNNDHMGVDILNQKFVDEYIKKFNPPYIVMYFGANKCKELGQILSFGYRMNVFNRYIISLTEHESGFPNWVYVYELK